MYDDREEQLREETEKIAPDWLRINVTSPALAPGTMQEAELKLIGDQLRRGPDGVLDDDSLKGLATSGWLRQDVQARGAYLSTTGLRDRLEHPELVMLNVPSSAVGWAAQVFGSMAFYLAHEEARFAAGEFFVELMPSGPGAFTFAPLGEEAARSVGLELAKEDLLLVLPLP
jgi:hypothetical protein